MSQLSLADVGKLTRQKLIVHQRETILDNVNLKPDLGLCQLKNWPWPRLLKSGSGLVS